MSRGFDAESLAIEVQERTKNREDRRTLLLMSASIASGLEANKDCNQWEPEHVAQRAVAVARAIQEEIDRGE